MKKAYRDTPKNLKPQEAMKITTNNVPRHLVYFDELTAKEQEEYIGREDETFFRYRGRVYSLSDFTICKVDDWNGVLSESYFSGIFVKVQPKTKWCPRGDSDSVMVGSYTI